MTTISTSLPSSAEFRFSCRSDGDFALVATDASEASRDSLIRARRRLTQHPWYSLTQVHSAAVVVIDADAPLDDLATTPTHAPVVAVGVGDALVTSRSGVAIAVQTADCVPVLLSSPEGVIGAAHAGWRGLYDGVLGATVRSMRALGSTEIVASVGPHICASCYEFGDSELATMAMRFGPEVVAATDRGTAAFDIGKAVEVELSMARVDSVDSDHRCTACHTEADGTPTFFSYRARGDAGRQTSVIWRGQPT